MSAGLIAGLIQGVIGRKGEVEAENTKQADLAQQRELAVYSTLAQSDDPEVRAMALSGLLEGSQPTKRKSGLAGWMGERQASPVYHRLVDLLRTPVAQPEMATTLPSRSFAAGAPAPEVQPAIMAAPASAGMPAQSTVTGGPPPTPLSYHQTGGDPYATGRTTLAPRQVFLSPIEKYRQEAIAKGGADIEGDISAYTPYLGREGAIERVMYERGLRSRSAATGQSIAGEAPDGQGGWTPVYGVFDRMSGQYFAPGTTTPIQGFRPRTTTGSASLGAQTESFARAMFGKRGVELSQPEMASVLEAINLQKDRLNTQQAISAAQRFLPNATVQQQLDLANLLKDQTAAPIGPGTTSLPAAPTTPPPAPGSTPAAAGTPSAAAPAGSAGTPAAAPGGSAAAPAPGAPPKPGGIQLPENLAGATKESGKPLDATTAATLAKAKQTNDLIDAALHALEPYKGDNTLQGAINMVRNYRLGYDSVNTAAAQLADLAGLQASAQSQLTAGSSRSIRYYVDRRQHVPKLPGSRQVMLSGPGGAGARIVQGASALLKDDEGTFDTPAQMYTKLQNAKANNESFIREVESASTLQKNPIAPMPSHTAAPGASTPSATPTKAVQNPDGSWSIQYGQ